MNYLLVSIVADPSKREELESQITIIQVVMNLLTFGLLLTFAGVIFKKAYLAARSFPFMRLFQYVRSTSRLEMIAAVRSPKASFGRLASHLSEVDALTDPVTEHTEQSLSVDHPKVYLANPMRKRIAKTTGASIEMTASSSRLNTRNSTRGYKTTLH